jgi:predicted ferric reductase
VNLFEYGRSRIRISRAWFINNLMLIFSIPIFVWTQFANVPFTLRLSITFFGLIVFSVSSIATFITWRKLVINDYQRLDPLLRRPGFKAIITFILIITDINKHRALVACELPERQGG